MKTEIIKRATAKEAYGFEELQYEYTKWKGAHWDDRCWHGYEDGARFYGTFLRGDIPHDVYTYESDFKHIDNWDMGVCIRNGNECSDCITPGAIFATNGMLRTALSNHAVYASALELIGIISPEIGSLIRELDEKEDK